MTNFKSQISKRNKQKFETKIRRGFTLVESLTVVFLSVVIVVAAYSIYLISTKAFQKNTQKSNLTQNARISLERISRDIRQTSEIVTTLPVDPGSGTPSTQLKFQDGHNLNPIQYITYYLDGTDLKRKISHYSFAPSPSTCSSSPETWVHWSDLIEETSPTECTDEDMIKANNISQIQFWGTNVVTTNLTVSDGANTYVFETKSLGRNIQ